MKRIIKSLAIAAVSALAFISCSREQNPISKDNGIHFTIRTSENPQVKSFIENNLDGGGTYTPKWSKGDELAMFVGGITDKTEPTATLKNISEKGETAYFEGTVTGIETAGTFKSFTPAAAFAKGYDTGNVGITLAAVQKPSSLTIDEACDILVAKESNYEVIDGTAAIDDLFFKRMFSVVKVALKGPASLNGEKVSKFSLTAPEGTVLSGRAAIDLTTATIDTWTIQNNSVTATYSEDAPIFGGAANLENEVWLVVNPGTIESGAKVVFAGETANYTFSKEVTLSKALTFPESQLAVINLTLAEENCTKKAAGNAYVLHEDELIEGDYLVVYEGKAMKASVASKRLAYSDVTVNNNTIANSDESIVWHISQSGGYWTIFNENTNTYAASTSKKNEAQLLDKGSDDKSLWTITKTVGASTFEFVNKNNSAAKINANLRNNGKYGFACYSSSTGGPLSLYRLSGPIDNTLPTLSVDQTSKVWAADATDAFVANVAVNSEGGDWTVTPETLPWATIAVDKAAGTITVTPNGANETETTNEATLTVTHTSNASLTKEISLKQNGKGGEATKTYILQFGKNYNSDKISAYDKSWSATCNGFTWNMVNWNNNSNQWSFVKAGTNKAESIASIETSTTMPEAISTVTMTIDAINTTKVTSITLEVIPAAGTTTETIVGTINKGNCVFNITKPQKNCKYKITVNCLKGSSNGLIQVSKVVYTNN